MVIKPFPMQDEASNGVRYEYTLPPGYILTSLSSETNKDMKYLPGTPSLSNLKPSRYVGTHLNPALYPKDVIAKAENLLNTFGGGSHWCPGQEMTFMLLKVESSLESFLHVCMFHHSKDIDCIYVCVFCHVIQTS